MDPRAKLFALALGLIASGCGGEESSPAQDASLDAEIDAGVEDSAVDDDSGDAALAPDGVAITGGSADIETALDCGSPVGALGMTRAGELQLATVDTSAFPDALCNDGTPAVLYYRPYRGEANRDRWLINFNGGGGCGSPEACAARWCSCSTMARCPHAEETTFFDINNMSGGGARSQAGNGIFRRDPAEDNPFADYNQVRFVYCSSDGWAQNVRGLTATTTHPISGEAVTYTAHFLGLAIADASFKTLRRDGVSALRYTAGGEDLEMPDLDEAIHVVLSGDSAGGVGVIRHLDRVAAMLEENHVGSCEEDGPCPEVVGLMDANVTPDLEPLDFSMSTFAERGLDTYAEVAASMGQKAMFMREVEEDSCIAWHNENEPSTLGECYVVTHLLRHHVTTPFFVRAALLDSLLADGFEDNGTADPELGPFSKTAMGIPVTYARVLRRELSTFDDLRTTAEEGSAIATAPGVFAPACSKHDTIHSDDDVFSTTIEVSGTPYTLFDVYENWRTGNAPSVVITADALARDTVCP